MCPRGLCRGGGGYPGGSGVSRRGVCPERIVCRGGGVSRGGRFCVGGGMSRDCVCPRGCAIPPPPAPRAVCVFRGVWHTSPAHQRCGQPAVGTHPAGIHSCIRE